MALRPERSTRRIWGPALMLALVLGSATAAKTVAARGTSARPHATAHKSLGVLTQGFKNDLATLDPAIGYDYNNWPAEKMVFDGLLDYDENTNLQPRLAAKMPAITNGGRIYTFTLRHGVHFSNGRELVASDVAYTINRVLNPKTKSPGAGFYLSIEGAPAVSSGKAKTASGIKVINKYTIRFTLSHPDVTFLNEMAMNFAYIVPKEVVQKEGGSFGHKPVGTGPFTLKQWVLGQKLVFVRNKHYFLNGIPKLDGVTFLIGLDPEVALLRVQRGQLDMLGDPIPGPDFIRIKNDPKYSNQLVRGVDPETSYITLNTHIKPFNNIKVRQALEHAIDKTRIVKILNGRGIVANQPLPPTMKGYDPSYKGYSYDPSLAKKLLAKAGYPHGFSTTLYTLNVDPQPRIAQSFQQDLSQIGVKVSIVPLASATIINTASTPKKAPMVWSGGLAWTEDFPDPSDFYGPILGCSSAVPGGWNWPFFCNKSIDAQGNKLLGMTNQSARLAGYKSLFRKVMDQAVWIPVNNDVRYILHTPQVHGQPHDFVHYVHTFFYERISKH
jgi:peptide/nickel transport system substrate-binding protein